jgi:hypothetical protein
MIKTGKMRKTIRTEIEEIIKNAWWHCTKKLVGRLSY